MKLIADAGGTAVFQKTDVAIASDVEALVAHAVSEFGAVDCAFNNAGILTPLRNVDEQTEDDFDRAMAINAKGVWLAMKFEIKQMLKQGGGTIVNNASVAGVLGSGRGVANYVASKHAVVGLTKAAALENARRGIRVNVVAPAVVDTDMGSAFAGGLKISMEDFGKGHPIGRVGRPEEIANAVLWLCSGEASFVTGHTLALDGGFMAQ